MREIALVFLRLGTTAFGGPAAHIAMMEEEFVRRRGWLERAAFLDLVGAASLLPGPSSTEVALYVGYRRAGWRGLLVAGTCFVLPAAILVVAIAWAYVRFGRLPAASGVLYGIKPAMVAIVFQALLGFARTALKTAPLAVLFALAGVASLGGTPPVVVLIAAAVVCALVRAGRPPSKPARSMLAFPQGALGAATGTTGAATLGKIFAAFLKMGSLVYGSGYVLLAFLRADLVERTGWLTESQLLDAVAVGQFTPGPVFTTATFVGYLLSGIPGALVATIGIFLPSFVLVAVSGPLLPRLRKSPFFSACLDGVNVASLGLMAVVAAQLGRTAIVDVPTAVVALLSAVALLRWRVSSAWLVLGGALAGAAFTWLR